MRDVSIQLKAFISNAQSQDIMIYAKQPAVQKNHLKCNTCQMLFRDAYSFKRHCTVQSSMCKESMSLSVMCYELVCGRFYPIPTNSNTALNASAMQHPKSTADSAFPTAVIRHSNSTADASSPTALFPITPTTTTQTTPSPINHRISASSASIGTPSTVNFEQYFNDSLPVSCLNKVSLVDMYLKKVVDPMDSIHEWRKVFYPYFVELGEDCETKTSISQPVQLILSTAIYIIRQCTMVLTATMRSNVEKQFELVKHVNHSEAVQKLCLHLNETRVISTHHASTSKSLITADGDYIIGNASFKREHYSKLIHNIKTSMWKLMRQIFLGNDWMVCLGSGQFEVRSPLCYAFAHFSVNKSCNMLPLAKYGDKWFFGEIAFTSNEGTVVCLKELELCDTIHPTHNLVQRLDAEFMLLLHGCGGGGERQSTIETMFGSQMRIAGGNIYYYLTHEKQGNIQTVLRDPGTCCLHQLKTFSMRDVRQLWAGLINCITSSLKLLPSKVGLRCVTIHWRHIKELRYPSFEESQIFRKYHAMLGEDQCMNSNQAIHFKQVSDGTMLESLRMLFGKDANFNSPEQKQMVQYCCQHSSNHKFIIIGCGGGKTLSLLIPVISSIITHHDIGCRIFIVPYSFLRHSLQSLFSRKLTNLFGSLVTVESYSKSEINESQLPSSLQQRMPNILILTPDSAANLIEYHSGALQRLNHDNSLKGVYIDEAQTILSEFSFRQSMEKLRRFTELECPITFLSGSFPRSVIPSLLNYFNISGGGEKSVDLVQSDDLKQKCFFGQKC
eukprot:g15152.t1 g15152   contig21:689206-692156(+)